MKYKYLEKSAVITMLLSFSGIDKGNAIKLKN
jgi:hypothetical protein